MISKSRRKFLHSSLAVLGISLVPVSLFHSCLSHNKQPEFITVDFLGDPELFKYYHSSFRKVPHFKLLLSTLESSMESLSEAVLIDSNPALKSTHAVMLLEQGKDIMITYPLASNLDEYNIISDQLVKYDRRLGMINPLKFYPSANALRDLIQVKEGSVKEVIITCHPYFLQKDFQAGGLAGTAQPLQRLVSHITGKFPVSVYAGMRDDMRLTSLNIDYGSFQSRIIFNESQLGWNMELSGENFRATADHTGLLRVNDEVEARISPSPVVWERALSDNMVYFLQAVRNRSELPEGPLDGLASIILNRALKDSLITGEKVNL